MNISRITLLTLGLTLLSSASADAAVRITALQVISTEANGKISSYGAHRFKTVNHGGQPCLYVIQGDNLDGEFINPGKFQQNGVNINLSVGTHTYTVYAENSNSYTWAHYTLNLHFDAANAPQISAAAPLNANSPLFFPPSSMNMESTETHPGYSTPSPKSLEYKAGATTVKLVDFRMADPSLFKKDRVGPFDSKSNNTFDYVGQFTLQVTAPPLISAGGVVNAASYMGRVAPGSLFSIFGSDLATASEGAVTTPLPTSLAGTSVTIGGKPAPLVFVSAGQINAQVPYEVQMGQSVPVVVTVNGQATAPANVAVMQSAPGIFQFGDKRAVVQNDDATVNTAQNGAVANSYVVAYLTGGGEVDNAVPTGSIAGSSPLSRHKGNVTATVNGTLTEIAFAGLTPQFIGLTQVNLKVPGLPAGNYPLVISVNGQASTAATITVK